MCIRDSLAGPSRDRPRVAFATNRPSGRGAIYRVAIGAAATRERRRRDYRGADAMAVGDQGPHSQQPDDRARRFRVRKSLF